MKIAILTTDSREHFHDYENSQPYFGTAPEALLKGFEQIGNDEIHVISCVQQPVKSPEKIAPNIWCYALHVPKTGWMRTFYQGCIRAARKKLREIQPDIVHGQGTERDCAISAAFSGYPNVITIHGSMNAIAQFHRSRIGNFYWLAARLETFALGKTAGVFCNSAYTERLVAPRAKKTWRVPNAVRPEFFSQPLPLSQNELPVLLNVGVLAEYKRQLELLAVARNLWQRGFRFEMQFAGSIDAKTDYAAKFLRQLAEAEKIGYARHLGKLESGELISAMDRASALVHFPAEEAFGLVVAEALARNLKLFAASVGGVTDIAASVSGAELFPMNDFNGLENSLARWMEAKCPRSGETAALMRERYHPQAIAQRHLEIYREVLT